METLLLERQGFEVATAEDGEEGYTVFRDHMMRLPMGHAIHAPRTSWTGCSTRSLPAHQTQAGKGRPPSFLTA